LIWGPAGAGAACDACVIAVPPRRLAAILDDAPAYGIEGLDAFEAMPIVDVHLWYDRPVLGCDFAALLDSPVQWVFEKSPGYVCCSLSAADGLVGRPESELVELGRSALAAVLPQAARARLLLGAATRDPEATFIPAPGVRRPGPATKLSNLVIGRCMDRHGVAGDHRIGSAQRAYRREHAVPQRRGVAFPPERAIRWRVTGDRPCSLRRCVRQSTGSSITRIAQAGGAAS